MTKLTREEAQALAADLYRCYLDLRDPGPSGKPNEWDSLWVDKIVAFAEEETAALRVERDALKERLEIGFAYDIDGTRVPCEGVPDGITTRNATIQLQDEYIADLRKELAKCKKNGGQ